MFYGGWGDYQEWADHDFRPKASVLGPDLEEQPAQGGLHLSGTLPTGEPPGPSEYGSVIGQPAHTEAPNRPEAAGDKPAAEVPPTPVSLPIGPRSVVPASRRTLARREKNKTTKRSKELLPLAAPPTPAPDPLVSPLADAGPWGAAKEPPQLSAEARNPKQMVRPYTRTGGRTRATYRLELETLLSTPLGREREMVGLPADHRVICQTCRMPRSTAEVAARLGLPLGAARVLIADVVDLGLLHVHETSIDKPSMDLLYRIHSGLRNL